MPHEYRDATPTRQRRVCFFDERGREARDMFVPASLKTVVETFAQSNKTNFLSGRGVFLAVAVLPLAARSFRNALCRDETNDNERRVISVYENS